MTAQRPRHPMTITLSLLLAANQHPAESFDYKLHDIIQHLTDTAGWSDEKKADLYARLAEAVKAEDRMAEIERKVSFALWQNDQHPYA